MLEITLDEIALSDASAIRTIIDELKLRQQYFEPSHDVPFPSVIEDWDARPYWARYLDDKVTAYQWTGNVDVWLTADAGADVLRRVVIEGLNGKDEAEALRAEVFRVRIQGGRPLTAEDIGQVADELFDPTGYPHQREFASALRNVRSYFKWEDREAIDGDGWILPIGALNLPPEDVELLREVFRRLPPIGGAVAIRDGRPENKRSEPIKNLKKARQKVKQHSGEYADAGFNAWVDECLQTKTDKWSGSRDPLYLHYKAWMRKGGHGRNIGEQADAKATALSEVMWGKLMRRRFPMPESCTRTKRSILYRVTVKRGA